MTKLTFCLAALSIIFGGPGYWLRAVLPGVLALLLLWHAGLAGQALKTMFRLLAPLALALILVHGLFGPDNRTILFHAGRLQVGQEGLVYATFILLRLEAALSASLLLTMTTNPSKLIQALSELGLSHQLAYLIGSPLLLLPQLAGRIQAIQAAQQSRGLETQGNVLQRIRALFPLVAPLVFTALVNVEEHALALEVRGFSSPNPKTSLTDLPDTSAQRASRWIMAALAILLLLTGLFERMYGTH